MKVIDEKGRLFGKLNIVDLLVIILIVAVAVVLGMKFLGGNGGTVGETAPAIRYTVRVTQADPASYEYVCRYVDKEAGLKDQLMASGKLLNGYVVDVTAQPHEPLATDVTGGDTLDLTFTIEAVPADRLTGTVGTQEVRIGKDEHIVKTAHFEFMEGVVLTVDWEE